MSPRLTLDRFEGRDKSIAVLIADDGGSVNLPRELLPTDVQVGEILTLNWKRERKATRLLASKTKALRKELDRTDPEGDVTI